jgi:hypothetical protein
VHLTLFDMNMMGAMMAASKRRAKDFPLTVGAGPTLWLRADKEVVYDEVLDVQSWTDQIGGRVFTRYTTRAPDLILSGINGRPAVNFLDGGSGLSEGLRTFDGLDLLRNLEGATIIEIGGSSAARIGPFVVGAASNYLFSRRDIGTSRVAFDARRVGTDSVASTSNPGTSSATTPGGVQFYVCTIDYITGIFKLFDRGATAGPFVGTLTSTGNSQDENVSVITCGASSNVVTNRYTGVVYEILVYPFILTPSQLNDLAQNWMIPRYNRTWTNIPN